MKNFNTLNPTDIFSFPENWQKFKFYNLFSINKEVSNNIEKEVVLSLTQKGIVVKDINSNKGQIANSYEKYTKVIPNDIVFNPMDLISGWVDIVTKSGVISPSYLSFRLDKNRANPLFILFLFQSLYVNRMLFNFGKGVATHDGFGRWAINEDTILKTNIFLPDLETQNIAVRYLERKTKNIDTLLEKLQNKIDLLNEQRTSMINDFVTKGLDPNVEMKDSGIEWIGEIPKHWTLKKITHVTNMIGSGTTPKSDNKDYYENGDINWLVTGDLNDDYIVQTSNKITQKALNDLSSLKIYPVNSLLLAMYGATLGKLGILKTESTVNQATCVLNFDESNSVDFWFYVFLGNRNYVESLGFGGGQPNISQEVVKGLRFPSPPTYEEQVDIVKMIKENLGNHDNIIKRENNRINLLKKYRQSLVSSVVTGKVQVTKDMV